jgi:hypothetical protein
MYQVPPAPVPPKKRYLRVDDPAEIAAIMLPGLRSPIGEVRHGECWAEAMSLAQFRRQPVEFVV